MSARKYFFLILSLTAPLLLVRAAAAQTEARIQVVQTGVDHLKEDLKYLVELSPTPALRSQWEKTLKDLIDSFADGLDPTKPIRVDAIIGKEVSYEMHFPLKSQKDFIANLKGLGFKVAPVSGTAKDSLFTITPGGGGKSAVAAAAKKPMYMRIANGYFSIAPSQNAVPPNLPDPIKAVQPLLNKKYDVVGSLKNGNAANDLQARKANFQELRRQLEAAMVFKRNEDKNEFALRKLSLLQNLDESERFMVETEELLFGWTTTIAGNGMPGKGRGEFSISALKETDLFKSTQLLAAKSSYFANAQMSAKPVVTGRINFAIDKLREDHLKEFYKTVRPVMEAQIDKRATLNTAEQKAAAKQGAGFLLDMLSDGLALNVVDTFLDLHSAGDGKHTMICGVRADNGKVADQIVKLLPDFNPGCEVKLDIQQIGEASLHSVTVPQRRLAAFQKLFPGENIVYVATSKEAVWGAAGVNAIDELTAAINAAAKPGPEKVDPRVVFFTAQAARLLELIDIVRPERQKIDESLSKEEQSRIRQRQKDMDQVRKLLVDATKDCDAIFSGEVKKDGNKVEGWLDVSECVLRFVGSVVADFAKNMQ